MSTSGTSFVQYNRDDLIEASLRKLGVLADGQVPTTSQYTAATMALNTVVSFLRTKGLLLWTRKTLTFTPTTSTYSIGEGETINTPYPLEIIQAYRTDLSGYSKIPVDVVSNYEFNQLPTNTSSVVLKVTYQPQVNKGTLKMWPTPETSNTSPLTLVYTRPFEYFVNPSDTADFPEEWYLPLIYSLSKTLASEYSLPVEDRRLISAEAKEYLDAVVDSSGEGTSIFVYPSRRY